MTDAIDRLLLEAQVRAARERGAFDDLPGRGKPLDLDDLSGITAEQRFDALLMRSCGELRPEITLLREIRHARQRLLSCESADEQEALRVELRAKAEEVRQMLRRPK